MISRCCQAELIEKRDRFVRSRMQGEIENLYYVCEKCGEESEELSFENTKEAIMKKLQDNIIMSGRFPMLGEYINVIVEFVSDSMEESHRAWEREFRGKIMEQLRRNREWQKDPKCTPEENTELNIQNMVYLKVLSNI